MNKSAVLDLLKVKKWLTVPDAAKHLSGICADEVTEADILRFALDGYLTLSVHFINGATVAKAKLFPICKDLNVMRDFDERFFSASDEVTTIDGVWDLPMVGSEKLDIENEYQRLTNGPAVIVKGFAYVRGFGGELWQLQERFGYAEYHSDLRAHREELKQLITGYRISKEKAKELMGRHNEQGWEFMARTGLVSELDNCYYCPAKHLPEDSVLVVRTDALEEYAQLLGDNEPEINETTVNSIRPVVKRENDYNTCIAQVIADFTEINGYAPATVEEVINRMKHKPPFGTIVDFRDNKVSINGTEPKTIANLTRGIKSLLEQIKNSD